jgi:alkanesulfonate monooxygenase SsuD/methylene tetrahydromethanopterin reductase-like flavin-dependent oxidoreductase (luciferase family)
LRFAFNESMCDPSHYLPLAQAAERLGFTTFTMGDFLFFAHDVAGRYPYSASGSRDFLDGATFLDPFQLAAAMGAVTSTLRFRIAVLKLPVRDPVLVAKQVSSLAVLTGERLEVGVGLSSWAEEYTVTGSDWASRGHRLEEQLTIIRGLLGGEFFGFEGEYYSFPAIKISPVPKTAVPLLHGGHSHAALRRAARRCDGVTLASGTVDDVLEIAAALARFRSDAGRSELPFTFHARVPGLRDRDEIRRLEEAGVTELTFEPRNIYAPDTMSVEQKIDAAARFADEVIAAC